MDPSAIIALFRKRDELAIVMLKQQYDRLCRKIAGNILSQREDVEECVNSAYYEIWNQIPPANPSDLQTYLCCIVRNIAINRLKYNTAQKRNPAFTVPLEEIVDCLPAEPDANISDDALADAISRFLHSQKEQHRKLFVRRYWYGDPVAEIAALYGMNEKTVATSLFRTRKKLKAFLQKEGYDYD